MSYAIIGFGAIGQAIARAFARHNIEVTVASRHPPETLLPQARAIGPSVIPRTLPEALKADVVILAVRYEGHQDVGKALPDWRGKTVIDAMNTNQPVAELDGLPSSVFAARSFPGARFVKGFNHLPAATLASDPGAGGGHRVVFLSSNDEAAATQVANLARQLGFAPVNLGKLEEGGTLVQARGKNWAPLIFQDLFKQTA
jgi:predicted dinucleotide-binding enzyme